MSEDPDKDDSEVDNKRALRSALTKLTKKYGKGTIIDASAVVDMESISTGSLLLDNEIGIGGLPEGRIVEIYGNESCVSGTTMVQIKVGLASSWVDVAISTLHELFALMSSAEEIYVKGLDDKGAICENRVLSVPQNGTQECIRVSVNGEPLLFATGDHLIFSGDDYVELSSLSVGDSIQLLSEDGEHASTQFISKLEGLGTCGTYDIKCFGLFHNYFADRILVHNCGKTSLSSIVCANAQEKYPDLAVGFVDVEHAFHPEYAKSLGLDVDSIIFTQPDSAEEALDSVLSFVESGAFSVVVLDSVGGLQTKLQLEKGIGEATMAEVARVMSQTIPKISTAASNTGTLVIFINQIRSTLAMFGAAETTMGGKALKFFSSVRLHLRKSDVFLSGEEAIGQAITTKIVKNKVGRPFGTVVVDLLFGQGFDQYGEIATLGIEQGIISKGGSWLTLPDGTTHQGKVNLTAALREDPEMFDEIRTKVFAANT